MGYMRRTLCFLALGCMFCWHMNTLYQKDSNLLKYAKAYRYTAVQRGELLNLPSKA